MTDGAVAPRARVSPVTVAWIVGVAIVGLAAILRLVSLPTRGTWDADQGHDMLVLRNLVQDGQIPLLGPPTSIGDFHHGMVYYLLLAPAAALSGVDPTAVTFWIALGGVAAVAITGWLAAAMGGRLAGLIAALLMAISASAVEESTFIWNPNLIALSSSIALAAAWHAWQAGRPRWWIVAGIGCVVTMQCHVLGVILTPVVAALLVADVRRRRRSGDAAGARSVMLAAAGWIAIGLLSYVPLAIHEVTNDWSEARAALAFLGGGGGEATVGLPLRLPIVGARVLGWPLAGLITAAPLATLLAVALVVAFVVWRGWFPGAGSRAGVSAADADAAAERTGVRWLGLGLLWTSLALAVGATSLATVVIGLPNDHYHAFADPMVFALVGVGVAALARLRPSRASWAGPLAAGAVVVILVGWNAATQPPLAVADGGWPAAEDAAARVLIATGGGPIALDSLPAIKSAEALEFPLEELEPGIVQPTLGSGANAVGSVAILCDQRFHETIGADCGGPAEDARIAVLTGRPPGQAPMVDRFEAAPDRWITVYSVPPISRPVG